MYGWRGIGLDELRRAGNVRYSHGGPLGPLAHFGVDSPVCIDMGSHMKTTIEIQDSLLEEAKRLAVSESTTVRALVEQGLRKLLAERKRKGKFQLRDASFKGRGLQPGVEQMSWERLREVAYEGRGG
jgi:Arc/MetJ family transcription regulator